MTTAPTGNIVLNFTPCYAPRHRRKYLHSQELPSGTSLRCLLFSRPAACSLPRRRRAHRHRGSCGESSSVSHSARTWHVSGHLFSTMNVSLARCVLGQNLQTIVL